MFAIYKNKQQVANSLLLRMVIADRRKMFYDISSICFYSLRN